MTMENDGRLVRVLTALYCDSWLIEPGMHRTLCEIATAHAAGGAAEAEQHAAAAAMPANPAKRAFRMEQNVAVLPVEGVIGRKFSSALYSSGVTSIDVLNRLTRVAMDDADVDAMVYVFDSPGGYARGVPESAALIHAASTVKPVVAYVDGQCCSAAYWMASAANAVVSMPSGSVGSIGAYLAVLDQTRRAEMEGVRVEMFRSGKHKGMGYPGTSLSDEQRTMLQASVDRLAVQFKADVRAYREVEISEDVMQGQSLTPSDAIAAGLADDVADFDAALRLAAEMAERRRAKGR